MAITIEIVAASELAAGDRVIFDRFGEVETVVQVDVETPSHGWRRVRTDRAVHNNVGMPLLADTPVMRVVAAGSERLQGGQPSGEQIRAGAEAIREWEDAQPKNAGAIAVQRTEIAERVLRAAGGVALDDVEEGWERLVPESRVKRLAGLLVDLLADAESMSGQIHDYHCGGDHGRGECEPESLPHARAALTAVLFHPDSTGGSDADSD